LTLRGLAAIVERCAAVTHVFGAINAWHLLRAVGRRPVVFTVAIDGPLLERYLYDKVSIFAAESESLVSRLKVAGVSENRIRLIYPGVDLEQFRPPRRRPHAFTVLFASSPDRPEDIGPRGIPLIIDAARRLPDMRFVLLWREWGDARALRRRVEELKPPSNVDVLRRDIPDMAGLYRTVHATVLLNEQGYGKSCPNSVVEGLAAGCPSIVADTCGIAQLIERSQAGFAVERAVEPLVRALTHLRDAAPGWSGNARAVAEQHFSQDAFVGRYRQIYGQLADRGGTDH
jgi:glycosyltransferase involved in cell wall biosynthesis